MQTARGGGPFQQEMGSKAEVVPTQLQEIQELEQTTEILQDTRGEVAGGLHGVMLVPQDIQGLITRQQEINNGKHLRLYLQFNIIHKHSQPLPANLQLELMSLKQSAAQNQVLLSLIQKAGRHQEPQ